MKSRPSLTPLSDEVVAARAAAIEVLLHNRHGTYHGLPRTAGWGYPEPYTRDLMICALGVLVSGNAELIESLREVLTILARNQTPRGHIPSLVHDPHDLGASDTTPLFLIAVALYRKATGERKFLEGATHKALTWMEYQSPGDQIVVAQQATSDWRDEQWVPGYGLYVNALLHMALGLHRQTKRANALRHLINHTFPQDNQHKAREAGTMSLVGEPFYALWTYKIHHSHRFDLLGNSLAILSGIASPTRARHMVQWIEARCADLRASGDLYLDLPPCLFPYILPADADWHPRYALYNQPGIYHNGGIWPFIVGFYVAALVAAGSHRLAEQKLEALTSLVRQARNHEVAFGFNEYHRAQDGQPCGHDWQSWSAAMYLYAAAAVEQKRTPFFEEMREVSSDKP